MRMKHRWVALALAASLFLGGCGKAEAPQAANPPQPVPGQAAPQKTPQAMEAEALAQQAKESFFDTSRGAQRHKDAIALADRAIALDPACYQAYTIKGIARAFQGNLAEALVSLDQAIALKPDYAYAHFNRGLALAYHQRLSEALPSYERAAQLDPQDPWIFFGMASIHSQQGRPQEALANLGRAIELNPYCKVTAQEERDKDFKNIRHLKEFQELIQ